MSEERRKFRCPPKDSQFKPGHSGNPRGRRKRDIPKLRDDDELFAAFLSKSIAVNRNGKTQRFTRQALLYECAFNAAMKGNQTALKFLLERCIGLPSKFKDDSEYFRLTSNDREEITRTREAIEAWGREKKPNQNDED